MQIISIECKLQSNFSMCIYIDNILYVIQVLDNAYNGA